MSTSPVPGSPGALSPFHAGERAVQERLGVRAKLEAHASSFIRAEMPDQHREFFAQLPFVLVGSVDRAGQPWASVLVGRPGFIVAPDPTHLSISARPLFADPLAGALSPGAPLGLLGVEPHTRRRNRANVTVERLTEAGFAARLDQSFGNCPKYIQARQPALLDAAAGRGERRVRRGEGLDGDMRRLIGAADTYFIASAFAGDAGQPAGVDVSHRGGKPGFVRIDDERTLSAPEFSGNFFFNTTGNLMLDPRAGLLFIDFASGDLLYLAVRARIVWDGAEVDAFVGAQRLFRFDIVRAILVENSLPLRWGEAQMSPLLERTGSWPQSGAATD
ncbi:putative pyridoxine 5'-phosphate oxidase superfamily flavin-nucleotide-binding protein [Janthinobacterium sp. CG_S6]|nr:pyridoxamine 5'-phosphate oxidase family protein [Janthinobacterium sp. CG3]MEC5159640.1 putative pyridoxine 5'-phosphate oxidase superfamily flavin-nucleotide-binding protein [Janthinobacterium sp. CG_S6]